MLPRLHFLAIGFAILSQYGTADDGSKIHASYFPRKVHSKSVYQDGEKVWTQEVTAVQETETGSIITAMLTMNGQKLKMVVSASKKGLFRVESPWGKDAPPIEWLRFPPEKGNKWDSKVSENGSKDASEIIGIEDIDVPAGKYRAIVVRTKVVWTKPVAFTGAGDPSTTKWYAPEVGLVKQESSFSHVVLKRFTLGAKK